MGYGVFFICFLLFLGLWAFTKEWLVSFGVAAVLWSVLAWFDHNNDEVVEERYEKAYGKKADSYEPTHELFKD